MPATIPMPVIPTIASIASLLDIHFTSVMLVHSVSVFKFADTVRNMFCFAGFSYCFCCSFCFMDCSTFTKFCCHFYHLSGSLYLKAGRVLSSPISWRQTVSKSSCFIFFFFILFSTSSQVNSVTIFVFVHSVFYAKFPPTFNWFFNVRFSVWREFTVESFAIELSYVCSYFLCLHFWALTTAKTLRFNRVVTLCPRICVPILAL